MLRVHACVDLVKFGLIDRGRVHACVDLVKFGLNDRDRVHACVDIYLYKFNITCTLTKSTHACSLALSFNPNCSVIAHELILHTCMSIYSTVGVG